jgi:hypothetical protein
MIPPLRSRKKTFQSCALPTFALPHPLTHFTFTFALALASRLLLRRQQINTYSRVEIS